MPSDQAVRLRALDPEHSFIVQAPAGSGKTEVLTQRFLRLLATADKPERILAITFTRKATQEMRTRINNRLAEAQSGIPPKEEYDQRAVTLAEKVLEQDRKLGWNLLENPNRLRITTIDGLCVQLLSRDPVHGPLWSGVRVLEDPRPLYREAIRRMFSEVDELASSSDGEDETARFAQDALVRVLAELGGDSRRLEADLMEMLQRRNLWERHLQTSQDALDELLILRQEKELESLVDALGFERLEKAMYLVESLGSDMGWNAADPEDRLRACYRFVKFLGTGQDLPYKPGSIGARQFPGVDVKNDPGIADLRGIFEQWHEKEEALATWNRFASGPPLDSEDPEKAAPGTLLNDVRRLLSLALFELKTVCAERGEADFPAVSDAAVASLGSELDPGDAMLVEDERIDHVLMDEFQDTSYTQFRLLEGLTAGWESRDGRTLFLVGDPMQSIYRFREANVGFFNDVVNQGRFGQISLESLSLTSNFRSKTELIEWFNRSFPSIFPANDESDSGAVSYTPVSPERGRGGVVKLHAFNADDPYENQNRVVAKLVQEKCLVSPDESLAVLVRGRKSIPALTTEFVRAGIEFEAVDMLALGDRPVVMDLKILARALAHPFDRVAWIALLRAPWCALEIAEIHRVLEDDREVSVLDQICDSKRLETLETSSRDRLYRLASIMKYALTRTSNQPLSRQVEMCWIQLGGPLCCSHEADIEDAHDFLDLLLEVEQSGAGDPLVVLEEAMSERHAAGRAAPVKVMTIHKAKGLQFDTVILPDLARRTGGHARPLIEFQEFSVEPERSGVLLAPRVPKFISEISLHQYLGKVDEERARYEGMRLLYVACTRARNELHLLADVELKKDGSPSIPASSFLGLMNGVFDSALAAVHPFEEASVETDQETGSGPTVIPLLRLGRELPEPALDLKEDLEAGGELKTLPDREAAALGTVLHEWLELVHDFPDEDWSPSRIEDSVEAMRSGLVRAGAPAESIERLVGNCLEILGDVLFEQGRLEMIRKEIDSGSWSELPLLERKGNIYRQHIIDLMVRTPDGALEILDYKTSPSTEASAKKWDEQLDRYLQLVEKLEVGRVSRTGIITLRNDLRSDDPPVST